ncbi:hypothetical protein Pyn_20733 [Prunus yedoensis var. nudiflora]|uniref:Uncharacterized protein n=1 Tax=Prunus yedoensis var. nudiflora TaxID=2094558 RepID=A0A314YFC2_PRUYE|nr:hypothetical protein Pyn_20733 [Prunus yedoensis var. nudiflora]
MREAAWDFTNRGFGLDREGENLRRRRLGAAEVGLEREGENLRSVRDRERGSVKLGGVDSGGGSFGRRERE